MGNGVLADFREWDKGFDFYAPQSFETPDGRRILLGWEGIGDIPYSNPTAEIGWQHCLTLPRELTVSAKGKLLQNPVRELVLLRKNEAAVNSGDTLKLELPFELTAKASGDIRVRFENVLQLVHQNGEFRLEFLSESASGGRDVRYADITEIGDIRIIADKASVEVYINGGETVMSARMYPEDTEISLSAEGVNGTVYELDGIEVMSDE
jgi:beta-fructofuranosidase